MDGEEKLKGRYFCDHPGCMQSFLKSKKLRIHQYDHTGVLPYECPHPGCLLRFLLPSKLKYHMKRYHETGPGGEKTHVCCEDGCPESFWKYNDLRLHAAGDHKALGTSFPCEDCDTVLKSHKGLQAHRTMHSEDQQEFECPVEDCFQTFHRRNNLKAHLKAVHKGDRPFVCTVPGCGNAFGTQHLLNRHGRQVHSTQSSASAGGASVGQKSAQEVYDMVTMATPTSVLAIEPAAGSFNVAAFLGSVD